MNVVYQIILVVLQRSTAVAGVIAPRIEDTGRDLIVGVPNNFSNKVKPSFCDLVPY